jgi:catechol 2,3-dioxygenase-like lactoylglutathione lyase family enzyme
MEINGVAHTFITVGNFTAARAFYGQLLPFLGLTVVADTLCTHREDSFAPGYYSVLFEDPDGTRLELNHVPGKGLLAPGTQIGGGYADGTQNG